MKAYLAGAIEYAPDNGEAWRSAMSDFIIRRLGHTVYNPLWEEPAKISAAESRRFRGLKTTDLQGFKRIVRKLIEGDLHALQTEIDYIVCLWDPYAMKGGGTYGELTMAYHWNIPVFMVTSMQVSEISGWILGCTTELFPDFEQLKEYLLERFDSKVVIDSPEKKGQT